MDAAKKLLENISEEEKKYFSEFMSGYYKRFNKLPPKDVGTMFIAFGTAVIAARAAWDNKYSPQRKDFHRHKDIDSFLNRGRG